MWYAAARPSPLSPLCNTKFLLSCPPPLPLLVTLNPPASLPFLILSHQPSPSFFPLSFSPLFSYFLFLSSYVYSHSSTILSVFLSLVIILPSLTFLFFCIFCTHFFYLLFSSPLFSTSITRVGGGREEIRRILLCENFVQLSIRLLEAKILAKLIIIHVLIVFPYKNVAHCSCMFVCGCVCVCVCV